MEYRLGLFSNLVLQYYRKHSYSRLVSSDQMSWYYPLVPPFLAFLDSPLVGQSVSPQQAHHRFRLPNW